MAKKVQETYRSYETVKKTRDKWVANDGSKWNTKEEAEERDRIYEGAKCLCRETDWYTRQIYAYNSDDQTKWVRANNEKDLDTLITLFRINLKQTENFDDIFQFGVFFLWVYDDPGPNSWGPGHSKLYTVEEVEKDINEELEAIKKATAESLSDLPKGE